MKLNDIVNEVYQTAQNKGWHDSPREVGTILMLMASELSEALEEHRNNRSDLYAYHGKSCITDFKLIKQYGIKPEGVSTELVDCVIRIFDYFGQQGWDFEAILKLKMEYNKTRSYRHGGKLC